MKLLDEDFIRKLDMLSVVSRKVIIGRLKGEKRSKRRGVSSEFAEHRNYSPGDDTRFLDWNIYGRLNSLFLKLFYEEEDLHVSILVDASESMNYGSPKKFDYARRLAASLGYIAASGSDRVTISAFSDNVDDRLKPFRGKAQVWRMFDFLESLESSGGTSLAASCRNFAVQSRGKGVTIIISDFLDEGGYDEALRFFVAHNQDVFVLHLLSRDEVSPELTGDLKLFDCETGAETEVSISGALLKTYDKNVKTFCRGLKDYCGRRGIGYLFAATDTPFEQLVLNYLRRIGLVK
jgi:uncharacterized protein (DUF58 family)